jgi:hypothetical protein
MTLDRERVQNMRLSRNGSLCWPGRSLTNAQIADFFLHLFEPVKQNVLCIAWNATELSHCSIASSLAG